MVVIHHLAAKALTFAHPLFGMGVPYIRETEYIPIRTSAHFILFDPVRVSPAYTMLQVLPDQETRVDRDDNFSDGHVTLPDELCTTESHYTEWNRSHPEFPVDKGHSAGSQYRRGNATEQSDIDTLAGVTPEASKTNRNVKGPLESAILAKAKECTKTYVVQGPAWYTSEPFHGKLANGQWIPDALWISCLFLHRKTIRSWAFQMENASTIEAADLREITLEQLEQLTGFYLWGNVAAGDFNERRRKLSGGDWWLRGQPNKK